MNRTTIAPLVLPPPPDGSATWHIDVYAHTHWDREWYLPFERYRLQLVRAIDRILDTLAADDAFECFVLDGQTIVLDDYLELRPEREAELRAAIQDGRIEVGPWYVLPDEFLVSGESLVRNLLEGRRGAARFADAPPVGYLPDPFGHVAQLPQVLAGFGLGTAIFSRGMGDEYGRLGSEFVWEGLDGRSSVLAVVQRVRPERKDSGYCNASFVGGAAAPSEESVQERAEELAAYLAAHARTNVLLFAAGEDHASINPELPAFVRELDERCPGAEVRIVGLRQVAEHVRASAGRRADQGQGLQRWRGELRGSRHCNILANIFSSRIALKQDNVRLQTELERRVEPLLALAEAAGIRAADRGALGYAWRLALQNQPHDSIGGCSVDETHEDMPNRTKRALEVCTGLLAELQLALGIEEAPYVFHADTVPVSGIVRRQDGSRAYVHQVPPLQLVPFTGGVDEVPSPGGEDSADVRWPGATQGAVATVARVIDERTVESAAIRVHAAADGQVDVALLGPGGAELAVVADALRFVDVADAGDEYDFGAVSGDQPIQARLVGVSSRVGRSCGIAKLELVHELLLPTRLREDRSARDAQLVAHRLTTTIRVVGDLPWAECETRWTNAAEDHRLRVVARLAGPREHSLADGHFALVERAAAAVAASEDPWCQPGSPVGYAESVAALEPTATGGSGVALLTRGLHEYEVVAAPTTSRPAEAATDDADQADHAAPAGTEADTCLELTLLRSTGWLSRDDVAGRPAGNAGPALPTPGAQCLGAHAVEWAIAPLAPGTSRSEIARLGRRFAAPPVLLEPMEAELHRHGAVRAQRRDIRAAFSPSGRDASAFTAHGLHVTGAVELSAVKPAEDGRGLIIRVFSPGDAPAACELRARPGSRVTECRMDETALAGGDLTPKRDRSIALEIPAGMVRSFRIEPV